MRKWISLSYYLTPGTPAYGNGDSLIIEHGNSISKGGSANTSSWQIHSHLGTHIDFPKHFVDDGNTLSDYDSDFWVCENPNCVDISPVKRGEIITPDAIDLSNIDKSTDLLLIKTGFSGEYREHIDYWQNNPGFSPDVADVLRSELPNLKMIGFDSISLSSYTNRPLGRVAHSSFLNHKQPILIIEDMNLEQIDKDLLISEVIVSPLMVKDADGSPCNVLAKIHN